MIFFAGSMVAQAGTEYALMKSKMNSKELQKKITLHF